MELRRRDNRAPEDTAPPVREVRPMALSVDTKLRNGELSTLVDMLQQQHDIKYDVIAPSSDLSYQGGRLTVREGAAVLSDTGVAAVDAYLHPTHIFEEGISAKLGIPRKYITRMREADKLELLDNNVNEWMRDDPRNFLVRGFRTDDPSQVGIARAFLSDTYMFIDHYDGLLASLDGIRAAGIDAQVIDANLSDRSMVVNIEAPEITARVPEFLENYVSPFGGASGRDLPIISAGLQFRNSEVGSGAYTIVPRIVVRICKNGMNRTMDMMRRVHLGSRMDEGQVRWSEDTKHHFIELVKNQTKDAVTTFLSAEYVQAVADDLEAAAGVAITRHETVERIIKPLSFSDDETQQILDYFMSSMDHTAGGVMQAVTALARNHPSIERAVELEDAAFATLNRALEVAVR